MKKDPVIVLLPVAALTYLFLGGYVEALILIGLFVPEMVIEKQAADARKTPAYRPTSPLR